MSSDPFNSAGGFSAGIPPITVIDANGNVVTNVDTTGNVAANNIYGNNFYWANGQPFTPGGGQGIQGVQGIQGFYGLQGLQGISGTGTQGIQGTIGLQGDIGLQGLQGIAGSTAAQGIQGIQGVAGNQGITGSQGIQGITGSQGVQGVLGSQGVTGSQGVQGITGSQGIQGITGSQGVQGVLGNQGVQGVTGSQGVQGVLGNQGVQGITGSQGVQGVLGNQGIQGVTGSQGVQGVLGNQGVTGSQGIQGVTGSQGVQGVLGNQGIQGITGSQGVQGVQGITGSQGVQGVLGNQGIQGITGSQGVQGVQGITGSQGVQGLQGPLNAIGGTNTQVQFNDDGVLGGSPQFVFDKGSNTLTLQNINVFGTIANNLIPNTDVTYDLGSANNRWRDLYLSNSTIYIGNAQISSDGNTLTLTSPEGSALAIEGSAGNGTIVTDNLTVNVDISANTANFTGNITASNANLGNYVTANFINVDANLNANNLTVNAEFSGNTANFSGNVILPNLTVNNELAGNIANFTGNVQANNLDVNLEISGNTANFSGNVILPNLTVNNELSGNNANFTGNLTAGYLFGNASFLQGLTPTLTVSQSNITGGNIINTVSNVTGLFFDTDTGFSVTDLANGNVVVSLGSTFKTWEVNGQPSLVAVGEDTVEFIAGNGIVITTDPNSTPQSITFSSTGGSGSEISNGNSNVNIANADGNITFAANGIANIMTVGETGVYIPNTSGGATNIQLGDPTQGNLVTNAVSLTNSSSVSNAIAQLNNVLGKLVPPSPNNFPGGQTLTISSLSTYRMANFVQTDNTPGANKSVSGGTTVTSVRRASSYTTSNIANVGPGDQGTITAFLNGADAGNRTLTTSLNGNGTYSNLIIFNNYDYNVVNANIAAGFWSVFSSRASGTVTEGWNEVKIADSATSNTNTPSWYYDSSAPGTPAFSNVSFSAPGSPTYTYSSTVPHYPNTNQFTANFEVNRLSGNMYPTSDTFITGTAAGAFAAPASVTYATAGVTTPLAQNLYVSSGTQSVSTTANVTSGFGASSSSPTVSANNSYNVGTQSLSPGANILYKTGTSSTMEEANIVITGTVGVGSGLAFRIDNPGSTDTPSFSASATAFNSQTGPLQTYDATIVAAIMKHDITNYATGYLPVGPNLSSGRGGSQYFTFKFIRTSLSKFDFKWTGTLAGLWVALPGSTIDSTSTLNGWLDLSLAYAGAGVPGANTGAGGNGSNGAALGGVAPLNSAQTNKAITATFGTVSSSSTATNEIYVRIKLTSGQSITAFSLQAASN